MKVRVLGSAAGGGFPQWNCNCSNCAGLRAGRLRARARTQSSIAVGGAGAGWVLVNASPDVRAQLAASRDLQPGGPGDPGDTGGSGLRGTPLVGIVLVDGQVDHTTGLYMLREAGRPWPIWCSDSAYADLTQGNPILRLLEHYCGVNRRRIELGEVFVVDGVPDVLWRGLAVASKPAPYSPNRERPVPGDNLALVLEDAVTGRSAVYAPGLSEVDPPLWQAMQAASVVLVDGTFWSDDEMQRLGASSKRARDMGHLAQSGPGGMLEHLERLPAGVRKILIHINNTNPILDEDSPQRAQLERRGVEVAFDGMEVQL